ncbi:uncharacterized protein LOC123677112 [Harmonia axyridis]|uniref:uncharacterized protein LOC123677112 n=1 Tax=Harmonia axyridis TaxID=115357 RepID=UPI001E27576A|nr:uncharacterized protein LOC123677112 [Harmonia axyridis]
MNHIPRQEIFCYPLTVHPKRQDVFAEYKRSAPTSMGAERPPSPPKRRSSRNNTTLRLITTMKVEKEKLPMCKRHEICFTSASDVDKSKVKYLRDKITCKLSSTKGKKSAKVTVSTKKPSTSSSKTTDTTTSTVGGETTKTMKKTKPELCCSKESKPCKICANRSEVKIPKKPAAKSVGTFGTEKRKILMNVPKFFEEKKITKSTPNLAEDLKSTYSSPNLGRKSSELSTQISASKEGKKILSRARTPSPLYSRRSIVKSKSTPNVTPVKLSALNSSLESLKSPTLVRKEKLLRNNSSSKKRIENISHSPNRDHLKKSKKEEINGKIANKKTTIKKPVKKSSDKSSKIEPESKKAPMKKKVDPSLDEIRQRHKIVHSDSFFQHLFLKDIDTHPTKTQRKPWLYEQTIEKSKEYPNRDLVARAMKIYLNNTKPVSESKFRNMDPRPRSVSPKSISFDKNINSNESLDKVGRSISLPPKLIYFSQTSRPVSPIVERKNLEIYQPPGSPTVSRSPSRRKIDALKQTQQNNVFKLSKSPSAMAAFNTGGKSDSSALNNRRTKDFLNEITYFTRRSSKFKDLNEFYTTLEKLGELERIATYNESKIRKKSEGDIVDFDRWQEVHQKERTEKEMNYLCEKLKEKENNEGFLYRPKDIKNYRWNRELDRGLRSREKSIDNIKGELERLKLYDSSHMEKFFATGDTYKPLWRGSSVLNLASHMVAKRSKSEGRVPESYTKCSSSDKLLTEGIGSRIWSSLSMDQVNILKEQLNEIYNHNHSSKKQKVSPEFSVYVPVENAPPKYLSVRRNSDISKSVTIQKDSGSNEKSVLSETDKKRMSQSLSKEILNRVSKPSVSEKKKSKESIGKIKTSKPREIKEERNDTIVMNKKKDHEMIKTNEGGKVQQTPTEPKNSRDKHRSSESGSTDESTNTVIFMGNKKEDVKQKVTYFEKALDSEEYIPTIHKPAESEFEEEKTDYPEPGKLGSSSSCQDLKELFGEKEIMRMTTYPLSSTRKSQYTSPALQLRTTTMSPCKLSVSETTSCDSLYRSRSLSPFFDEPQSLWRSGEVKRLKDKFEFVHNFYNNRSFKLRRCFSDSNLYKKSSMFLPALVNVDVDYLRKKYEYPVHAGRGRSRIKRGGVVSPLFLRAEDRFMPHINIISKIATLCSKKYDKPHSPTNEDLSEILSLKSGDVEKLKEKFDKSGDISILGKMFTSSPDIKELKDIAPFLTASWTAHRFPRTTENTISLSSPKDEVVSVNASSVRKPAVKSSSSTVKSSILKPHQRTRSVELPSESKTKSRTTSSVSSSSQPELNEVRYRSHWTSVNTKPSVTFKGVVLIMGLH